VTLTADPRLLVDWDEAGHRWKRDAGRYQLFVGKSAAEPELKGEAKLTAATMAP
jgi:hypothetical protein